MQEKYGVDREENDKDLEKLRGSATKEASWLFDTEEKKEVSTQDQEKKNAV